MNRINIVTNDVNVETPTYSVSVTKATPLGFPTTLSREEIEFIEEHDAMISSPKSPCRQRSLASINKVLIDRIYQQEATILELKLSLEASQEREERLLKLVRPSQPVRTPDSSSHALVKPMYDSRANTSERGDTHVQFAADDISAAKYQKDRADILSREVEALKNQLEEVYLVANWNGRKVTDT